MKRGPSTLCALAGAVLLVRGVELWSPWVGAVAVGGLVLAVLRPRAELSMLVPPGVIALACLAPWRIGVGAVAVVAVAAAWSAGLVRRRPDSPVDRRRQRDGQTGGRLVVPLLRLAVVASIMAAVTVGHVTIERTVTAEPADRLSQTVDTDDGPVTYNRVGERGTRQVRAASTEIESTGRDASGKPGDDRLPTTRVFEPVDVSVGRAETISVLARSGRTGPSGDGDLVGSEDPGSGPSPWWLALAGLAVAVIVLRLIGRLPSMPRVVSAEPHGDDDTAAAAGADVVAWYDALVEGRGHRRGRTEPILAHGRRIADETDDDRYRRLARLVSSSAYSDRPITRDMTELFDGADDR